MVGRATLPGDRLARACRRGSGGYIEPMHYSPQVPKVRILMRWLTLAGAVLALLALAPSGRADDAAGKRDDSASEKLGMKLSLQCWTFNKLTFFETVDKAKGLGIKYLKSTPARSSSPAPP